MIKNDDFYEMNIRGLFRVDKMKTIRIVCKCKTGITFGMPQELIDGGGSPIVQCPVCQQEYTIYHDQLVRKQDFQTIEGILLPKRAKGKPIQPSAKD